MHAQRLGLVDVVARAVGADLERLVLVAHAPLPARYMCSSASMPSPTPPLKNSVRPNGMAMQDVDVSPGSRPHAAPQHADLGAGVDAHHRRRAALLMSM